MSLLVTIITLLWGFPGGCCRNGTLPGMHGPSSWPCPEMAKSGMRYGEPGWERLGMHISFHPKAFMANFVFNTNVWASKDKSLQVPGTHLFNDRDLFPFYYPANTRWDKAGIRYLLAMLLIRCRARRRPDFDQLYVVHWSEAFTIQK